HDHFTKAVAGGDEYHAAETRLGVEREQYARRADVRTHHQLHACGQEHFLVLETLVHAVGDRAVVVQRRKDFLDLVQHVLDAGDVEECFLLAGKTCIRQIFRGRGRTHRDRNVSAAGVLAELRVGIAGCLFEFAGQFGIDDPAADFLAGRGQCSDIFDVQRREPLLDPLGETALFEVFAKRVGGSGKSARHRHTQLGEIADHFAERSILAADLGKVGHAQLVQPQDKFGHDDLHVRAGARKPAIFAGIRSGDKPHHTARSGRIHSAVGSRREIALNGNGRRTVFFVSDSTGITAETIGNSILAQFEGVQFDGHRIAFVDTPDKAQAAALRIKTVYAQNDERPIVVNTVVDPQLCEIIAESGALMIDVLAPFIGTLELELGARRSGAVNRAHGMVDFNQYEARIDATNYALAHDDGIDVDYTQSDVVLVGVSRVGKTPTCLYMALHYGVKAANYPLTDEDLERDRLPRRL